MIRTRRHIRFSCETGENVACLWTRVGQNAGRNLMEFVDESGNRPRDQIEAALRCITEECVRNPLAMSKSGEPLLMHYLVIRDALDELLSLRA